MAPYRSPLVAFAGTRIVVVSGRRDILVPGLTWSTM
jgi:hypothetical protein